MLQYQDERTDVNHIRNVYDSLRQRAAGNKQIRREEIIGADVIMCWSTATHRRFSILFYSTSSAALRRLVLRFIFTDVINILSIIIIYIAENPNP